MLWANQTQTNRSWPPLQQRFRQNRSGETILAKSVFITVHPFSIIFHSVNFGLKGYKSNKSHTYYDMKYEFNIENQKKNYKVIFIPVVEVNF